MRTSLVCALCVGALVVALSPADTNAVVIFGQPDDTTGVYLFSAGDSAGTPDNPTGLPGGQPTDDIVAAAIAAGTFTFIGDEDVEQFDALTGPGSQDSVAGTPDIEITEGLTAIDDFGFIAEGTDDTANFDLGAGGYFLGGLDPAGALWIGPDGIAADGSIDENDPDLGGFEVFIFEDAELSGMIITLAAVWRDAGNNPVSGDIVIDLLDRQIDPLTQFGADDTMIAIDLDTLPVSAGLVLERIDSIKILDDNIPMGPQHGQGGPLFGDTTVEIDAIAVRAIPEPSVVILLSLTTGGWALRRRRGSAG